MPKCKRCGKSGLFLKVSKNGLCYECEKQYLLEDEIRQNEMYNTERIFQNLSHIYVKLTRKYDYPKHSIEEALNYINKKNALYASYKKEVLRFVNAPRFYEILISHSKEDFSYFTKKVVEINLTLFDRDTPYSVSQRLLEKSHNILKDLQKEEQKIFLDESFSRELNSLKHFNFAIEEGIEAPQTDLLLLENIKYSNITQKTNFERLGNFVSIDVETTGLSHLKDKIIEVSAVRFEYWEPVCIFETLLNPEIDIPSKITSLTGISNTMVENAPSFNQIVNSLSSFIGNSNIVGHNLEFDLKFLYKNGLNIFSAKRKYFDTLSIAKRTLKRFNEKRPDTFYDVDDYKLTTLCDYYKIRGNLSAHRSSSDSLATGYLFKHLSEDRIEEK